MGFPARYFTNYVGRKPYEDIYKEHGGGELPYAIQIARMGGAKPKTMLDIGCATGLTLQDALNMGLKPRGIEASQYAMSKMDPSLKPLVDFGYSANIVRDYAREGRTFDIVLETTAQYMQDDMVSRYLDDVCKIANHAIILITAHGDEVEDEWRKIDQPFEWWGNLMGTRGWKSSASYDWIYAPAKRGKAAAQWGIIKAFYKRLGMEPFVSPGKDKDYKPVICIDFDGVCTNYKEFKGENVFDDPKEGAADAIRKLRNMGFVVILYTCREDNQHLRKYLAENGFEFDGVNTTEFNPGDANTPKPAAEYYIDDHNLEFKGDWSEILDRISREKAEGKMVLSIGIPKMPVDEDIELWQECVNDATQKGEHDPNSNEFVHQVLDAFHKRGGLEKSVHMRKPPSTYLNKDGALVLHTAVIGR
jgi:hypothetical protein